MRATIRHMLITGVPQVNGRVFEPFMADAKREKPYLILKEGIQDTEADWAAFSTVIEVWPYVARTTFQQVDTLTAVIINVLHRARFAEAGKQYLAEYQDTSRPDYYDEDWQAITRGLRFRIFELGWLDSLTYIPDPISTLRTWTTLMWPALHTSPNDWNPADMTPGLYWRLMRIVPEEKTAMVNWIEVQIAGHILAPSPAIRLTWIRRITEQLASQRNLRMNDGGIFEMMRVAADSEADAMRRGQIQLTGRYGVLQNYGPQELLRKAEVRQQ